MVRFTSRLAALCTLWGLAACRPPLEPPTEPQPPVARVLPAPGPGVDACWVESRGRLGFTASALVVRHPEGDVVIDTGNSTNFSAEIEAYHGSTKRWLATFPGALQPRRPLADELTALGVDPDGLRWIVPTHAHLDHLGGALDLPPTPILMSEEEIALVEQGGPEPPVVPAHAAALRPRMEPLAFRDEPYEIFDRHADLFGDGTVVVVPLPGHTPGAVGVFVRLADGRRVFHVGDAVNDRVQIDARRGRTRAMRSTDQDRPAAERTVARLHRLAQEADDILFLPAHERDAWRDVFEDPRAACPAPRPPAHA